MNVATHYPAPRGPAAGLRTAALVAVAGALVTLALTYATLPPSALVPTALIAASAWAICALGRAIQARRVAKVVADPAFAARVARLAAPLAARAGVPLPTLLIVADPTAGAAIRRYNRGLALVVTTGVADHDDDALAGLLAHELGHVARGDVAGRPLLFVPLFAAGAAATVADHYHAPLASAVLDLAVITAITALLAVCQRQEYAADAFAVRLQGDTGPTVRALTLLLADERRRRGLGRALDVLAPFASDHPPTRHRLTRVRPTHRGPPP